MRTLMTIAVLGAGLLAVVPITQGDDRRDEERDDDDDDADTLTLAVYGDAPYGTSPTDDSQLLATPAFIAAINAERDVKAVLHVGDIHSGKQFCIEAYDRAVFDLWRAFERPLIFTPGDNEWTDCHKPGQGGGTFNPTTGQIDFVLDASGNPVDFAGGDPLANLDLVRSLFFPHPGKTLGRHPMRVRSQAHHFDHRHPRDGDFVENVMWEAAGVLFVTINLPGGSNNDTDVWYGAPTPSAAQLAEVFDRSGADLRWLDTAFERARAHGAQAVLIQLQADLWDPEKGAAHLVQYEPFVQSIASHTLAFNRPVLLVNGDSHVYLSDNPLSASDPLNSMHPGHDVPNFHRIVVHGSTTPLEWLRLTIDRSARAPQSPNAFGPFRWERVMP